MRETFNGTIAELGQIIVANPGCCLCIAGMKVTAEGAEVRVTNGTFFGGETKVRLVLRGLAGLADIVIRASFDTPIECVIDRQP